MEKTELRRSMLKKRLMIEPRDVCEMSGLITHTLLDLDCIQNASCVMAYCAFKNEPDLMGFINALLDMGKDVALPYVTGDDRLIAVDYNYDSVMKSNIYGIPEPVLSNESENVEPDVVLVPGVAFGADLNRIGYGVGYFDRFLKETNALKLGICFDMQVVPSIKAEPHDVRMDIIVTEKRVIKPEQCV
jgi:5-formyltetrahydrofolate cyclo-ligase